MEFSQDEQFTLSTTRVCYTSNGMTWKGHTLATLQYSPKLQKKIKCDSHEAEDGTVASELPLCVIVLDLLKKSKHVT